MPTRAHGRGGARPKRLLRRHDRLAARRLAAGRPARAGSRGRRRRDPGSYDPGQWKSRSRSAARSSGSSSSPTPTWHRRRERAARVADVDESRARSLEHASERADARAARRDRTGDLAPRSATSPSKPSGSTQSARARDGRLQRGRAGGRERPAQMIVMRYEPPRRRDGRRPRPRRQGDHLRHGRDLDQARRGHGGHEGRHVRRRGGRRRDGRDRRRSGCPCARSPSSRRPRTCPTAAPTGPATSSRQQRQDDRGDQHRRRGTARPRRRALVRARAGRDARGRPRDADRRDGGRARRHLRRRLRERRRLAGRRSSRPASASGDRVVADAAASALPPL